MRLSSPSTFSCGGTVGTRRLSEAGTEALGLLLVCRGACRSVPRVSQRRVHVFWAIVLIEGIDVIQVRLQSTVGRRQLLIQQGQPAEQLLGSRPVVLLILKRPIVAARRIWIINCGSPWLSLVGGEGDCAWIRSRCESGGGWGGRSCVGGGVSVFRCTKQVGGRTEGIGSFVCMPRMRNTVHGRIKMPCAGHRSVGARCERPIVGRDQDVNEGQIVALEPSELTHAHFYDRPATSSSRSVTCSKSICVLYAPILPSYR